MKILLRYVERRVSSSADEVGWKTGRAGTLRSKNRIC